MSSISYVYEWKLSFANHELRMPQNKCSLSVSRVIYYTDTSHIRLCAYSNRDVLQCLVMWEFFFIFVHSRFSLSLLSVEAQNNNEVRRKHTHTHYWQLQVRNRVIDSLASCDAHYIHEEIFFIKLKENELKIELHSIRSIYKARSCLLYAGRWLCAIRSNSLDTSV